MVKLLFIDSFALRGKTRFTINLFHSILSLRLFFLFSPQFSVLSCGRNKWNMYIFISTLFLLYFLLFYFCLDYFFLFISFLQFTQFFFGLYTSQWNWNALKLSEAEKVCGVYISEKANAQNKTEYFFSYAKTQKIK